MYVSLTAAVVSCALLCCSTADPRHAPGLRRPGEVEEVTALSVISSPAVSKAAGSTQGTSVRGYAERPWPWSWLNSLRGDTYALDDVVRRLEPKARPQCDPSSLTNYRGTNVQYAGSVLVDPAFVERLTRFESVVNEVALEVYGRVPNKVLHAGAYSCRSSRNRSARLSEHALGNALDVVGFSFNGATKEQRAMARKGAAGYFNVTVAQHWNAERSEVGRLHRHFLRTLADRVVAADVFRVALGPSHPGHGDHLHFDMSPWNYTHL